MPHVFGFEAAVPSYPNSDSLSLKETVFINPIWQDEVQRIGKQLCTPTGYRLHGFSDLIGFIALLLLFAVPFYLVVSVFRGTFTWTSLWTIFIPIVVAIIGNMLHSYSWHLADVREFEYDYEERLSSWRNESGTIETFNYEDWRENYADKSKHSDG